MDLTRLIRKDQGLTLKEDKGLGDKIFYKIGEVSQRTGLEPYVLRFWEAEFPALHPRKNRGGQRVYIDRDIQLIFRIKKMLYEEGLTIAGAKKRLNEERNPRRDETGKRGSTDILHRIRKELEDILHTLGPAKN